MPARTRGQDEPDRARFGETLRRAMRRRGVTQVELSAELGGVAQSAVSAWTTGAAVPNHQTVFRLERLLELPGGYLSQHLGFLPVGQHPPCSVEDAIREDPLLNDVHRQALLALYREFVFGSRPSR